MTKTVPVDAKVMKLHIKVCDRFECEIDDQHGETIRQYEGYVPGFMPGEHYGDYLILDIDLDTGKIINWTPPSATEMQEFINNKNGE
jgi:hypothetical protein